MTAIGAAVLPRMNLPRPVHEFVVRTDHGSSVAAGAQEATGLLDDFQLRFLLFFGHRGSVPDGFVSSPVLIDLDEHVIPFDLDRKTPHACRRRRASDGPGLDVE